MTDADGDNDTAAINLGAGVFQIEDDGPNAVVANAAADTLVLDETRAGWHREDGDSNPAGLADSDGELCRQLRCAGRLRQRRSWQRELFAGADRFERGVRAVCAWRERRGGCLDRARTRRSPRRRHHRHGGRRPNYFTISIDPATGVVTFSQITNIWHANTGSDDDTATLTLANANLLQAGADGDRCRRRHRHGVDQSGRGRVPDRGRRSGCGCGRLRLRTRLCWTRRGRLGRRRTATARPAGLATVTANFADNFCGGPTSAATVLAARAIRWC